MISTGFTFDGIHSSAKNLSIVRTETGLFPVAFASAKEIIEDKVTRNPTPYFFRTSFEPITFKLTFALIDDYWTNDKKYEIANWLFKPTYKEFISDDYNDKILYIMATNMVEFMTNGTEDGYIEVEFRCKHPYALTPPFIQTFDLSDNTITTNIELYNRSNIGLDYYYPIVEFQLTGASTGVSLKNYSDNGRVTTFSALSTSEVIYLDNQKRQMISSTGNYRFDTQYFNGNWFRLVYGKNLVQVTGACMLQVKSQFPIYV